MTSGTLRALLLVGAAVAAVSVAACKQSATNTENSAAAESDANAAMAASNEASNSAMSASSASNDASASAGMAANAAAATNGQ